MLREKTVFAQKIIDYYAEKGVDCSIVDEHLSLLVTLCAEGETHEFRYGNRAFAGIHGGRKFCLVLERELAKLRSAVACAGPARARQHKNDYGRAEAWARYPARP